MKNEAPQKHDVGKVEHAYRKILHFLELFIAGITVVVLLAALGLEIYQMIVTDGYFADIHNFLHSILTIVVGLEFVRMLIDMTPGNTLEVLIMATARYVILNHDDPITLLIGIVCVAALFATRRFLIRRSELKEELVEIE